MASLNVLIVTPDRTLWEGEAESVTVPSQTGDFGVLPRMEPTLAMMRPGKLTVRGGGADKTFTVEGGFASVDRGAVTVMVDDAEQRDD